MIYTTHKLVHPLLRMEKNIRTLAVLGVALALLVIGLGAWTRLVDAGLGCPDWPTCYGHLTWPTAAEEITRADALYDDDAPYDIARAIPEMVHRIAAAILGLLVLGIFVAALRTRPRIKRTITLSGSLLLLIIAQGAFGYLTVSLKLWPHIVTLHLLGGLTTLGLLFWIALGTPAQLARTTANRATQYLGTGALGAVIGQIALGGWLSANYAALSCPSFPGCRADAWWPSMDFAAGFNLLQQGVGVNYLGGQLGQEARIAIHITHRLWAVVVSILVLWLAWRLRAQGWALKPTGTDPQSPPAPTPLLLGLLLLQLSLGILNIVLQLPLAVAVAHNLGAAALLLGLLYTLHRTHTAGEGVQP